MDEEITDVWGIILGWCGECDAPARRNGAVCTRCNTRSLRALTITGTDLREYLQPILNTPEFQKLLRRGLKNPLNNKDGENER